MSNINSFNATGRVGKEGVKTFENERGVSRSINLWISNSWKDKTGNWVDDNVNIWCNFSGKFLPDKAKDLAMGDVVAIQGKLAQRTLDVGGKKVVSTSVRVDKVHILSKSNGSSQESSRAKDENENIPF